MSCSNVCLDTAITPLGGNHQVLPFAAYPHLLRQERQKLLSATAKIQLPEKIFKNKCSSWNHLSMQMSTQECWHWKCFWERVLVLKLIRGRETSPNTKRFKSCFPGPVNLSAHNSSGICVWLGLTEGQRSHILECFGKCAKSKSFSIKIVGLQKQIKPGNMVATTEAADWLSISQHQKFHENDISAVILT